MDYMDPETVRRSAAGLFGAGREFAKLALTNEQQAIAPHVWSPHGDPKKHWVPREGFRRTAVGRLKTFIHRRPF